MNPLKAKHQMYLFKQVTDLQQYITQQAKQKLTFGFVPTMGALHQGHLSLIERSNSENNFTICSIFINPTQFNESKDFKKYPFTPSKDIEKLISVGCQVLFLPTVNVIYPPNLETKLNLDLAGLDQPMEGHFRPGHFEGVVQVVKRLLDIVQPTRLYMGQKDYQQFRLIQYMIQKLNLSVKIVMCPIEREKDGLAMSSRNRRLSEEDRKRAPAIYQTLSWAKEMLASNKSIQSIQKEALQRLELNGLRPEYFEIVDGNTLQTITTANKKHLIVACTAAWASEVRLIDNMILNK